jgi:hypothetical protein
MSDSNQRIEITVSPEGAVSIKTSGFTGSSCRDATKAIEKAMGVSERETLLREFHQEQQAQRRQLRQGQ